MMAEIAKTEKSVIRPEVRELILELRQSSLPQESAHLAYEQLVASILEKRAQARGAEFTLEDALAELQRVEEGVARAKNIVMKNITQNQVNQQVAAARGDVKH